MTRVYSVVIPNMEAYGDCPRCLAERRARVKLWRGKDEEDGLTYDFCPDWHCEWRQAIQP